MFNIVEKRRWFFVSSGVLILLGIVAMALSTVQFGTPVRLGVELTGGSLFVLSFGAPTDEMALMEVFQEQGVDDSVVQRLGAPEDNSWQVWTREVTSNEQQVILDALETQVAPLDRDLSAAATIASAIGSEVAQAAGAALLVTAVGVVGIIWFSFRNVPYALRYGVSALVALVHDILIALGFYSVMGIIRGWSVDALSLTAILAVTGFSMYDTIVVFGRIRENLSRHRREPYEQVLNRSIWRTIHRSLATQLTVVFVMIAIILFGGETIRPFISIMLVGMLSSTYSSIFIAIPLLVSWEAGARRRAARATA